MMSHDYWTDRLSDYLDDDLSPPERAALERHLRECDDCRGWLADVRELRQQARALPERPPAADLWPGIARRLDRTAEAIAAERHPARRHVPLPLAIAAGLIIAVSSALGAWVVLGRDALAPASDGIAEPPSQTILRPAALTSEGYERAVGDLMRVLDTRRDVLSPRTVEVLERNLAIIDAAIAQSRAALERDPADGALAAAVARHQRTKLAVLRQVEQLVPVQQ